MRRIYTVEDIELQDWKDAEGNSKPVRIYPLTIKKFRQISEIMSKLQEENKVLLDVLEEATIFAMKTYEPELANKKGVEDHIDWPTMEHIIEIAAGISLRGDSPNPMAT